MKDVIDQRMWGCLYGQAVGDALGVGAEFMSKEVVQEIYPEGLRDYGQLVPDAHQALWTRGEWTDDTEMMLCIMRAFDGGDGARRTGQGESSVPGRDKGTPGTGRPGFRNEWVAANFKRWLEEDGRGIGSFTYKVLEMRNYVERPEDCAELWWRLSGETSAPNGALMRTSVVGIPRGDVRHAAEEICRLTHPDPRCVGSCVIVAEVIQALVWEGRVMTVEEVARIGDAYDPRIREWVELAYGSEDIAALELDERGSRGYTLRTLAAALWCLWHAGSFEEGLLAVVNEGGDADTNGAVAGAVLGARDGLKAIPERLREGLLLKEQFDGEVERFVRMALRARESSD